MGRPKIAAIWLLLFLFGLTRAKAASIPALKGYVNDYAGMISPEVEVRLEALLKDLEKTDSTQFVILTVPDLGGLPIEDYALEVAETYGLGQKGRDNGVLLLVARKERRIRIEVGYGLEGVLTDVMAGRIIDQIIRPRFRAGDFDGGFMAGAQAIVKIVRGEFKGLPPPKTTGSGLPLASVVIFGAFIILAAASLSRLLGALAGALALPALAALALPWSPALLALAPVGLVMAFFLPALFSISGGGKGAPTSSPRAGSAQAEDYFPHHHREVIFWIGPERFGGPSSGWPGDFGGFSGGGGGFGGGGASGDW
ncbi:MAG TPA: TPM domain-containing protein [Thermodesulfatator sp.]|nr:TPM domain-containing protein [Thermodesulfatator sp.]